MHLMSLKEPLKYIFLQTQFERTFGFYECSVRQLYCDKHMSLIVGSSKILSNSTCQLMLRIGKATQEEEMQIQLRVVQYVLVGNLRDKSSS